MARENQGLQIGLIVFVMLTIILGVTTYLFYRQYDEVATKAKSAAKESNKMPADARKNADEANELKRMIGVATSRERRSMKDNLFTEDMKKFGSAYPEETRFYRPLLEKMAETIKAERRPWPMKRPRSQDWKTIIRNVKRPEICRSNDLGMPRPRRAKIWPANNQSTRTSGTALLRTNPSFRAICRTARKEAAATLAAIESKLLQAGQRIKTLLGTNEEAHAKLAKLTTGKMGSPNGEITWVNQREGTVWINIGRADALSRQVNFSVYPADSNETTEAKRALRLRGLSAITLAEARILDDQVIRSHHSRRQDLHAALEPWRKQALRAGRPDGYRRQRPQRPGYRDEHHPRQRRRGRLLHSRQWQR